MKQVLGRPGLGVVVLLLLLWQGGREEKGDMIGKGRALIYVLVVLVDQPKAKSHVQARKYLRGPPASSPGQQAASS